VFNASIDGIKFDQFVSECVYGIGYQRDAHAKGRSMSRPYVESRAFVEGAFSVEECEDGGALIHLHPKKAKPYVEAEQRLVDAGITPTETFKEQTTAVLDCGVLDCDTCFAYPWMAGMERYAGIYLFSPNSFYAHEGHGKPHQTGTVGKQEDVAGKPVYPLIFNTGDGVLFGDLMFGLSMVYATMRMGQGLDESHGWEALFGDGETLLASTPIPELEGIKPSTHVAANSKVTQVLRAGKSGLLFKDGGFPLSVGKKSGQLMINFGLAFDDPVTKLSQEIDAEDVAVIEAVTTLRAAGNNVISPFQIAESMGYVGATQELQDEIHERVMRMRGIVGHIDWTEQAKAWKVVNPETGRPFENAEISGNLLSAVVVNGTDDQGNRFIRYQLSGEPITFTHARLVGQVINYDQSLLDLRPIDEDGRRAKRVTRDQKKILRAILAYVAVLKNPRNKMSNVISYESLWSHEGYVPSSDSTRKRSIKTTHGFLRALQEVGEIYGFEAISERSARHKQIQVRVIVEKPTRRKR